MFIPLPAFRYLERTIVNSEQRRRRKRRRRKRRRRKSYCNKLQLSGLLLLLVLLPLYIHNPIFRYHGAVLTTLRHDANCQFWCAFSNDSG
jgi:hypothetical protein